MGENESLDVLGELLKTVNTFLQAAGTAQVPERFNSVEGIEELRTYIFDTRNVINSFSKGDFNVKVPIKGIIGGMLKNLQANLRHMSWQVQMVAKGDFTQKVEFMGEFAEAFNSMVLQMDTTLRELKENEEKLQKLATDLRKEIAVRTKVEEALTKSHKRYQELALKDPLTDINNRRHFYELANTEIKRMQRNGGIATLGMLDVDHFKRFNDTYGHLGGDTCLKSVAAKMKEVIRDVDVVGRYGGEEFIMLFPQTPVEAGYIVAERLRNEIANTPIAIDTAITNVTVSIGVTDISQEMALDAASDNVLSAAIAEADSALYYAKKTTRNRAVNYRAVEEEIKAEQKKEGKEKH